MRLYTVILASLLYTTSTFAQVQPPSLGWNSDGARARMPLDNTWWARDLSANGVTSFFTNGANISSIGSVSALHPDATGATGCLRITSRISNERTSRFTFGSWIYQTSYVDGSYVQWLDYLQVYGTPGVGIMGGMVSSQYYFNYVTDEGFIDFYYDRYPITNSWHRHVLVFDGVTASNITYYIDGTVGATYTTGTAIDFADAAAPVTPAIGMDFRDGSRQLKGYINEFFWDNRAWSAQEVRDDYETGRLNH